MTNPVVLKMEGGLGNQLFQIAAGFYLASKLKTDLYIDQYSIAITTAHGEVASGLIDLENINLINGGSIIFLDNVPSGFSIRLAKRSDSIKRFLIKLRLKTSNPLKWPMYVESVASDSAEHFLQISQPMKIHGNFQSWKIVEQAVQYGFPNNLKLKKKSFLIEELESQIDFKSSIAIHLRLGEDSAKNYNFTQPTLEYYLRAMDIMRVKLDLKIFYILSDDLEKAKDFFSGQTDSNFHFLDMPIDSSPIERLYILSLFGGIICANSTFCGWAAWNIYNSGGEVIVPVPYSDDESLGSRDFPNGWVQLDKNTGKYA